MDNAHRAGVGDTIRFSEGDFRDVPFQKNAHLVTNPPYGKRMGDADIDGLYSDLENIFLTQELTG